MFLLVLKFLMKSIVVNKLFESLVETWVAGNEVIVKNVNANIPVSLSWLLRPFLAFLCFPGSAQFIASGS